MRHFRSFVRLPRHIVRPVRVALRTSPLLAALILLLTAPILSQAWFNGEPASLVLGQPDFTSSNTVTTAAGMMLPYGVAVDPTDGKIFVSDTYNNRILRFASLSSLSNGVAAEGVLGQPNFTSGGIALTQSGMTNPHGITVDSNGTLWVADYGNSRVLHFVSEQPPTGEDTIGIYRSGTFYLRLHNNQGFADISAAYTAGTKPYPVVGDWTGAGFDSICVMDQATANFYLRNTITAGSADETFTLGNPNDTPYSGRWSSSATHAGVGVYRNSNGVLYLKNALSTGFADFAMVLGVPGDEGVAGDWTGKGFDSPGIYRPSATGYFLSNQVTNGSVFADITATYGTASDFPVVGDWLAQGHDGIGMFRPSNGFAYLKNAITTGFADNSFFYSLSGDIPVAGHWQVSYPPIPPHAIIVQPLYPPTPFPLACVGERGGQCAGR